MKTLILYAPVIHVGYQNLIRSLNPDRVMVVSDEIANRFDKRRKDIRALHSADIITLLRTLFPNIIITSFDGVNVVGDDEEVYMPIEDISDDIVANYLVGKDVIWESVFLRYDRKKSSAKQVVVPDRFVTKDDPLVSMILEQLKAEASKSPDWWLQVPAAVVKNEKILSICHNRHVPSDVITYALGDPRSTFTQGVGTNISKSSHAEPRACFLAGVEGCKEASLFVGTFPCPQCANFLAFTGLKSLYFVDGYAMVDGAEDLKRAGIEIVKVQ